MKQYTVIGINDASGEEFEDLGTCDLEALGITGFSELDEKEIRIDEE